DIVKNVWDASFNNFTNVVDVYINYLRNKIDRDFETRLIHTIRGVGYMLREKQ
ncbi:MAG: winged-helix transcriptional response regulator, partial [Acidobacteria bacterium]|nr:winged-helix transcriptional response regulator [Acidobacteriota bacterium]